MGKCEHVEHVIFLIDTFLKIRVNTNKYRKKK